MRSDHEQHRDVVAIAKFFGYGLCRTPTSDELLAERGNRRLAAAFEELASTI